MCTFVRNWQIDENLATGSYHEVIMFDITDNIDESDLVDSPLNSAYNTNKAEWIKFAETLKLNSVMFKNQILTLLQSKTNKNLKQTAILLQN